MILFVIRLNSSVQPEPGMLSTPHSTSSATGRRETPPEICMMPNVT